MAKKVACKRIRVRLGANLQASHSDLITKLYRHRLETLACERLAGCMKILLNLKSTHETETMK